MAVEIRREELPQHVNVKLGEPFRISPNLNQTESDRLDGLLTIPVPLNIDGLGTGGVQIKKDKGLIISPDNYDWEEFLGIDTSYGWTSATPAGPFNILYGAKDGKLSFDPNTLPLQVQVYVNNLTIEQLEKIKCLLRYKEKEYLAITSYDDMELKIDGTARANFWRWYEPSRPDEEISEIFFPQDPEVFKNIEITLSI